MHDRSNMHFKLLDSTTFLQTDLILNEIWFTKIAELAITEGQRNMKGLSTAINEILEALAKVRTCVPDFDDVTSSSVGILSLYLSIIAGTLWKYA